MYHDFHSTHMTIKIQRTNFGRERMNEHFIHCRNIQYIRVPISFVLHIVSIATNLQVFLSQKKINERYFISMWLVFNFFNLIKLLVLFDLEKRKYGSYAIERSSIEIPSAAILLLKYKIYC